jgi:hypothetical protein
MVCVEKGFEEFSDATMQKIQPDYGIDGFCFPSAPATHGKIPLPVWDCTISELISDGHRPPLQCKSELEMVLERASAFH